MIQRFPGQETRYMSFDQTIDPSRQADHGDFLNTIQPSGLPPHELILKPYCPIILLRNLNPAEGLCNGTHLICLNFACNLIHAQIALGNHSGKQVLFLAFRFLAQMMNFIQYRSSELNFLFHCIL